MKAELSAYWRFVRQMPVVAVEALNEDILIVSARQLLIVCEIKVSIADMRHDIEKPKHDHLYNETGTAPLPGMRLYDKESPWTPSSFYFGVPRILAEKALKVRDELYPYAGLISVVESNRQFRGHRVEVIAPAKEIHKRKLPLWLTVKIVKAQSASIANAYARLAK